MKKSILLIFILFIQYQNSYSQTIMKSEKNSLLNYTASIAGKSEGLITKEEIISAKNLQLEKGAEQIYHIISFKLTITGKGRDVFEAENQNNGELTTIMIEGIKKSNSGNKLFIEYIKAVKNTNHVDSIKYVKPLSFSLK